MAPSGSFQRRANVTIREQRVMPALAPAKNDVQSIALSFG